MVFFHFNLRSFACAVCLVNQRPLNKACAFVSTGVKVSDLIVHFIKDLGEERNFELNRRDMIKRP